MRVATERALTGQHVMWGSPTFAQCRIGWDEMYRAAGAAAAFKVGVMEVHFPGGGRVTFRSLDDPDNARGYTADGLVLDEASMIPEQAWHEIMRPVIADTNGWAIFVFTPKGRNWVYRESIAAHDQPDSMAWQIPTLGVAIENGRLVRRVHPLENPSFPFAEAERMFQTMPERSFRQEFMAEFIEDAGLVFRNVRAVCSLEPGTPEAGIQYSFGVDWARSYDWTVLSVFDMLHRRQVALERFNKVDYQFQLGRLKVLAEQWRPTVIVAEANAMGTPLIEQLQRDGLPVQAFVTTAQTKTPLVEAFALAIERGTVGLLNDATQIAELEAYDMERLPGGAFRYSAPAGLHDDIVMADCLAWSAMDTGPFIIWSSDADDEA